MITTHPNNDGPITVSEGSNIVLRCKATGVSGALPKNSVSNGGRTLTLHNLASDDSGQYYCEVDNRRSKVTSNKVQVTVKSQLLATYVLCVHLCNFSHTGVPRITNNPSDVQLSIVRGDEQVTLTCIFTGDDINGSYWERVSSGPLSNSNNISILSIDKTTLTITISRARSMHTGNYRCVVYSQWGVAQSRNVQVTVISKKHNVLM